MGDMADMYLYDTIEEEGRRDDYVSGNMSLEDAFESGFVDHQGVENVMVQEAWNRNNLLTFDSTHTELKLALADLERTSHSTLSKTQHKQRQYPDWCYGHHTLNPAAMYNLRLPNPTCNICEKQMTSRIGKFGKFYFCKCDGQPTVSDAYWQNLRNNLE